MKKRFLLTLLMLALVLSVAVISVAAAAPTGLGVEDGKLTGTESGKTYEYAKVTFPAGTVDEASYADYSAESTTLAAGVYSVRVKGETDAATVWVKGTNYGTITWASNDTPTQGAWTLVDSNGTAYKPGNPFVEDGGGGGNKGEPYGFAHQIFADSANKGLMQTAYLDSVYTYFFKDDEIVNASDFAGFEFRKDNGWGGRWHTGFLHRSLYLENRLYPKQNIC